jgi:hypothetical protein
MTRQYNKAYLDGGVTVKKCGMCDRVFPFTLEYFGNRGKWGRCAYCKSCTLGMAKESKHKKRDKGRQVEYKPRFKYLAYDVDGTPYKKCNKCEVDYPHTFEYFDTNKKGQGGLQSMCRKCRLNNNHRYAETHWIHSLSRSAQRSSERKGLEYKLSDDYIQSLFDAQGGKCYWTGVTLVPSKKVKYPLQPSLDRLDGSRGYVKGNVVLCCFVANIGRNTNSVEEFKNFLITLQKEMDYTQWEN